MSQSLADDPEIERPDHYTDLFETYLEHLDNTYDRARSETKRYKDIRYWLDYLGQNRSNGPREADSDDLGAYVLHINSLGDNTIDSRVSSISVFYSWLLQDPRVEADIEHNPRSEIDLEDQPYNINSGAGIIETTLKDDDGEDKLALSMETIDQMAENTRNPKLRNKLILKLLRDTALRSDELSRIKLRKIDWENRAIEVRSSKLNADDHPDLYHRTVFFTPETEGLLTRWVNDGRHVVNSEAMDSEYLFLTDQSLQMRPSHISRVVKRAARRTGEGEHGINEVVAVDGNDNRRWLITAHRIRTSVITHWVNNCPNLGLESCRRMAGHAKLETTQSYVKTDWETVRRQYQASFG